MTNARGPWTCPRAKSGKDSYWLMSDCTVKFIYITHPKRGFPCGARVECACQCTRRKRCRFNPWVGKIPWRRAWQPTPVFLPGESHGQRSLACYSPYGGKELDTTEVTQHARMHATQDWRRMRGYKMVFNFISEVLCS